MTNVPDPAWYLDTDASNHITPDLNNLSLHTPYIGPVKVAVRRGQTLPIQHMGFGMISNPSFQLKLNEVFHVPQISANLLLVQQLTKGNDCIISFDANTYSVQDKQMNRVIYRGSSKNGVYSLSGSSTVRPTKVAFHTTKSTSSVWDERLGHPNSRTLDLVLKSINVPINCSISCRSCDVAEIHKQPLPLSTSSITTLLYLLRMDVWGPSRVSTPSSFRNYLVIIDDYSRFSWVYLLKKKCDVFDIFCSFKSQLENLLS